MDAIITGIFKLFNLKPSKKKEEGKIKLLLRRIVGIIAIVAVIACVSLLILEYSNNNLKSCNGVEFTQTEEQIAVSTVNIGKNRVEEVILTPVYSKVFAKDSNGNKYRKVLFYSWVGPDTSAYAAKKYIEAIVQDINWASHHSIIERRIILPDTL